MVRLAEYGDVDQIIDLFEEAADRSAYELQIDRLTARQIATSCIASIDAGFCESVLFVSEVDGKIDGVFVGMLRRFYELTDLYMAANVLWYVKNGSLSAWPLLRAFEDWAQNVDGTVILRIGITDGIQSPERFTKVMQRKGYRAAGTIFERKLENGS